MFYYANSYIDFLLAEDAPRGDLTTRILGIDGTAEAEFFCRTDGMVALCELAARTLEQLGLQTQIVRKSGQIAHSGDVILRAKGDAQALHLGYKNAQCLLEIGSGVARLAHQMCERARAANPHAQVFCTRKAPPGLRQMFAEAICSAGAQIHRAGLSESVLIFAQHSALANAPIAELIERAKAAASEHKIIAEAANLAELEAICRAGAHIVQADKFSLKDAACGLEIARKFGVQMSAAGGINAQNIGDYAALGIDILVTSAPYFAKPADISTRLFRAN